MIQTQVRSSSAGLDKSGEVLYLAVAVLMIGVGGLVGDADRKECDNRRNQIEPGVRRLGQDAKTSRRLSNDNL